MPVSGNVWICLSVRDLDRSVGWYRDVFGLDVLSTNADTCAVDDPDRFTFLIGPASPCVVGLQQRADRDGAAFRTETRGPDHLTLAAAPGGSPPIKCTSSG